MKRLFTYCLILLGLYFTPKSVFSQIPNDIILALRSGNAQELSVFLNDNVELYLYDKNDVYSKNQTTQILTQFFEQNHPNSLSIIHQSGKKEHQYVILLLNTDKESFQLSFLMRKINEKVVISQLQIEKSES
ncbi:MAG: DUF4783 domain-containing protein [Mangrovibacterium sp.]